jgi:hypothetical protein
LEGLRAVAVEKCNIAIWQLETPLLTQSDLLALVIL